MHRNDYIDHTLLKPEAVESQFKKLCDEAIVHQFATVCVNPSWVPFCANQLKNKGPKVCTVIGFPLGAMTTETKVFETQQAISIGADEIDMVLHIGRLKQGDLAYVQADIQAVVQAATGHTVKVIFETCLLTEDEIIQACHCAVAAGATFVKTSTGFSTSGATPKVVALMAKNVAGKAKVKAAGGVRTVADLEAMIAAGASRIGTSAGVQLMEGITSTSSY
jgi:deoxyribose-phosphate aldolase